MARDRVRITATLRSGRFHVVRRALLYFYDPKFVTRNALSRNELRGGSVTRNMQAANLKALPADRAGFAGTPPANLSLCRDVRCNAARPCTNLFRAKLEACNM